MAEAVAAFYAVETAVEGAAVGAYAASRPTVPLHVRYRKLRISRGSGDQSRWTKALGNSLNVVKGKAYLFGGDVINAQPDSDIRIITLPQSLDHVELDFRTVKPEAARERPLEPYSTASQPAIVLSTATNNQLPQARAFHASTSIDSNIFIVSGRQAQEIESAQLPEGSSESCLYDCETVYCFSTQTLTWSVLPVDIDRCKDGVPPARTKASCASTTHPRPGSGIEVTTTAHGTVFLHGGYDVRGQLLRDTWSFDVSSRSWTRWPNIPEPLTGEAPGQGRIIYQNDKLYQVGDGFGKVMILDINIAKDNVVGSASGPRYDEVAVKPSINGWRLISFGGEEAEKPTVQSGSLPMPREDGGFVAVTTGAGRFYNLYFMGQAGPKSTMSDVWSLQIQSQNNSAAAVKDWVRGAVKRSTGENEWSLCEIIESTKEDGPLELPGALTGFAYDNWADLGGANILIVGGQNSAGEIQDQAWIMSVE